MTPEDRKAGEWHLAQAQSELDALASMATAGFIRFMLMHGPNTMTREADRRHEDAMAALLADQSSKQAQTDAMHATLALVGLKYIAASMVGNALDGVYPR